MKLAGKSLAVDADFASDVKDVLAETLVTAGLINRPIDSTLKASDTPLLRDLNVQQVRAPPP